MTHYWNRIGCCGRDGIALQRLGYEKTMTSMLSALVLSLLDHLLWGKPVAML